MIPLQELGSKLEKAGSTSLQTKIRRSVIAYSTILLPRKFLEVVENVVQAVHLVSDAVPTTSVGTKVSHIKSAEEMNQF